jgi:DNA-binding XRE family transcriptional regulator
MGDTETGYGTTEFAGALGLTIKVLRTDRGLERKALADRAGISYSHLASIEAGQKQPSPQVLTAIAEALGIASHELLESVEHRRALPARGNDPWWLTGRAPVRPGGVPVMAGAPRPARPPYDSAGFPLTSSRDRQPHQHLGVKSKPSSSTRPQPLSVNDLTGRHRPERHRDHRSSAGAQHQRTLVTVRPVSGQHAAG